jgi:hypothetical protein
MHLILQIQFTTFKLSLTFRASQFESLLTKPRWVMLPTMGAPVASTSGRKNSMNYGRRANIDPTASSVRINPRKGNMVWEQPPESVLIIRKLDVDTVTPFIELASWLLYEKKMQVYVEEKTLSDHDFHNVSETFIPMKSSLRNGF